MVLNPVNSSNISQVGYDESIQILIIKFKNGTMYEYSDVPLEVYRNFIQSQSLGKFFTSFIRGVYAYKIISPEIK